MEALFGDLVEQHKETSDPIKISLMLDVANGLLYLHSQNPPIIHRDLSAANVLVSVDLRGRIADLGVAKLLGKQHNPVLMLTWHLKHSWKLLKT